MSGQDNRRATLEILNLDGEDPLVHLRYAVIHEATKLNNHTTDDPEAYEKAVYASAARQHKLFEPNLVDLDIRVRILQISIGYFARAVEYGSQGQRGKFQECMRRFLKATLTPGAHLDGEDARRRMRELKEVRRRCDSWETFASEVKSYIDGEMGKSV